MDKCRILIPQGCRSDKPVSDPIIKRLEKEDWCIVKVIQLEAADYMKSYQITEDKGFGFADILLACGDRIEMSAAAQCAFLHNIPIAFFGAGIINDPIATYDDLFRHQMTLISEIALCDDKESYKRCWEFLTSLDLERRIEIHEVGLTYLDDIEVDECIVPKWEYDLILYNPTTMYQEDLPLILKNSKSKNVIWIGSNPDPHYLEKIDLIVRKGDHYLYHENLPRPIFLGLLKKCKRYISNSSNIYTEAPLFLKPEQIIQIGDRNKNRNTIFKNEKGASDRIVKILKKWWERK